MNHYDVMKTLSTADRRKLTRKSDVIGLAYVSSYVLCMGALSCMILMEIPCWPLLMLPLGIMIVFLFTLLHETSHKTVFKSAWLNRVVAQICGFLIFVPAKWFKHFHFEHHRYTQDPDRDPELVKPKPDTISQFVLHISGVPFWMSQLRVLWRNACGDFDSFVPAPNQKSVRLEAILTLFSYALLFGVSALLRSPQLLFIWCIPAVLGQPFLRLYLLAEHSHCASSGNVLINTRTVLTNWFIRKLAWNMPYHIEHHAYPGVPFYRLPDLHVVMRPYIQQKNQGYVRFYRSYIPKLAIRVS